MDAALDAARTGMSGTLVIRGEPGVGKTSVLDYAAGAADFTVIRAAGVESEQDVGFAAIHRLVLPLLSGSDRIPPPQRRALETVLGRVDGDPPDRFLVGLAVLTLLSGAAEARPLLCLVDDAQWIDGESADLLAFVARRLYAENTVLMVTIRDQDVDRDPFAGLPYIRLKGLDSVHARKLLNSTTDAPIDPLTLDRIVAETGGNPLALIELGRDLSSRTEAEALLPGEPLPLGRRLEEHFVRQVQSLPAPVQRFLLIAAAEPNNPYLTWNAAKALGVPSAAAEHARGARLLNLGQALTFRHPLIRAAVYGAASPTERRRIHSVLADLADPSEPDARASHRAAAAVAPDESVAAELDRAADRAQSRGGWAARYAFLARAAELTPGGSRRSKRLIAAAEAALVSGLTSKAEALLEKARTGLTDPLEMARANRIEAGLLALSNPGKAPRILLAAAERLRSLDRVAALDAFVEALQACLVSCQLTVGTTAETVGRAALAAPRPKTVTPLTDAILTGFATRFSVGYCEAVPALQRAVDMLCAEGTPPAGLTRWAILGTDAAVDLWDADGYRRLIRRLEQAERERGALDSLRITLGCMGHDLMWAGDFAAAEVAHSEATEIAVALGGDAASWEALKIELLAWQGRDEDVRFVASLCISDLTEQRGSGVVFNLARVALVILDLAEGRYEDALANAQAVVRDDSCPHGSQVLPLAVEAAVRSGDTTSAVEILARLRERATASGTDWGLGLLSQAEALAGGGDPEPHYLRAVELLGHTYVKTDLARTHLLYGEWLRRENRRNDAREQLRIAFDLFDRMGAMAFGERARAELLAIGGRTKRRTEDATRQLTAQENQIASLAALGETNQEIAQKLFLSTSTVDYHLRKVFRKLSVTSRRNLAAALDSLVS